MPNDDQMLSDLRAKKFTFYLERAEKLEQSSIRTYADLLRVLRDKSADAALRSDVCWTIASLPQNIDGRKAVPILLKLLDAENRELRRAAINAVSEWRTKRVAKRLIDIAANRAAPVMDRYDTISILNLFKVEQARIEDVFQSIMHNQSEDVQLRSGAIEWFPQDENMLGTWIDFLSDESADVRFWAAYRLSQAHRDLTAALPALDRLAAYDHSVPKTWGWHVDREALYPLEQAYSVPYRRKHYDEPDIGNLPDYGMYLVSPATEYWDFSQMHRHRHEDGTYETPLDHPIHLKLDPDWLKSQIGQAWPDVVFNMRQPKPQTYLLDWYLQIDGQDLLGGLHRDQYGVVLSGKEAAAYAFAAWYRSIIAQQHTLYLYEWADEGTELTPDITAERINQIIEAREESLRAPSL